MRINSHFVTREIAGEYVVIPTGELVRDFNGMITLNEVAYSIWKLLQDDVTFEQILKGILDEYEVDEETATEDITAFIMELKEKGILE